MRVAPAGSSLRTLFLKITEWLGNAHANEHINKVGACDEKLFFICNIGNGLLCRCEWKKNYRERVSERSPLQEAHFAFFFAKQKEGR
ncbi:MAG: hypothetical protein IKL70_06200, partial [Oscillospiraceae bacterium]|nr:hypothetical protein [Oscillospiraceae bacterium]